MDKVIHNCCGQIPISIQVNGYRILEDFSLLIRNNRNAKLKLRIFYEL